RDLQGRVRKHVPDYLVLADDGPVVVDVKPRHRPERPEVASTFAWTRDAVSSRGWRYEVWSEPDPRLLENIRFLAGYRRDRLFDAELVNSLRVVGLDGMSLGEAFQLVPAYPRPLVKAAVLHLLWSGHVTTALDARSARGTSCGGRHERGRREAGHRNAPPARRRDGPGRGVREPRHRDGGRPQGRARPTGADVGTRTAVSRTGSDDPQQRGAVSRWR
ncbi:TnsA-like heteromeric transposase endonuclease subunit, partial [Streptomyces sp. WAC02707]